MYRIAVIFESTPFDRKGMFNAVHERIKALKSIGECSVDVYCIQSRDNAFTRAVRHTPKCPRVDIVNIEDVQYRMLWYRFSVIDHIAVWKLHRRPCFFESFMHRCIDMLRGYDFLIAHSFTGGLFAYETGRLHGVPYVVNWHGSDIHTHPWRNPLIFRYTGEIMNAAVCNFFVSKALMTESDRIVKDVDKQVLYNGVSDIFCRYTDKRRAELRAAYGVGQDEKIVAFVGSLAAVKNVRVLQPVFHKVNELFRGKVKFWIIGDGKLRRSIVSDMASDSTLDVRFFGNVHSGQMPSLMNCMDVLVLPSLNEGLPLVCMEAIRCGADVVGSAAGGIPEIISSASVVQAGDYFIDGMAGKIVERLLCPQTFELPPKFSWMESARKELKVVTDFLSNFA